LEGETATQQVNLHIGVATVIVEVYLKAYQKPTVASLHTRLQPKRAIPGRTCTDGMETQDC